MSGIVTREEALEAAFESLAQILKDRGDDTSALVITESSTLWDDGTEGTLALDSLDALDLITSLEEQFEVVLPEDVDFETIRTVGDAVDMLMAVVGEPERAGNSL